MARVGAKALRIENPARSHNHVLIDFNDASNIEKGNYRIIKFFETLFTMTTPL